MRQKASTKMYEKELQAMISACQKASKEIMRIYSKGFHVDLKEDKSPVTDADLASNKILRAELSQFSSIGWLSEEDADNKERLTKKALFIVDPLDGTEDFVQRDGSFGINIALVVDRKPVVSVVGVPALDSYAYAIKGQGSYYVSQGKEERLHVSDKLKDLILVQSKTHSYKEELAVIERHKDIIKDVTYLGASLKAIALAQGKVDASVRFTPYTKEWDVCAPELIVTEAGGIFTDSKLNEFIYNREDVYNHDGYSMFNRVENEILLK